jgi:hypothetical protein
MHGAAGALAELVHAWCSWSLGDDRAAMQYGARGWKSTMQLEP